MQCFVCLFHCCCLQDVMFAFERTKLKDWVADIKQLIQKDLRGIPGWGAHTRYNQGSAISVCSGSSISGF